MKFDITHWMASTPKDRPSLILPSAQSTLSTYFKFQGKSPLKTLLKVHLGCEWPAGMEYPRVNLQG